MLQGRVIVGLGVGLLLAGLSLATAGQSAATLTTWALPQANSLPAGVAVDAQGMVFFAEFSGQRMARLHPGASRLTEWHGVGTPNGVAVSTWGVVYYADSLSSRVCALLPDSSSIAAEALPSPNGFIKGMALARMANGWNGVWFCERTANRLGVAALAGDVFGNPVWVRRSEQYVAPAQVDLAARVSYMKPITTTVWGSPPQGTVSVTRAAGTVQHGVETWALPYAGGLPDAVVADATGRVWTSTGRNALVAYSPAQNLFTTYSLPAGLTTSGLAIGPLGDVWYTDPIRSRIASFDSQTGVLTQYLLPTLCSPTGLVFLPNSLILCFVEWGRNCVAMLNLDSNVLLEFDLPIPYGKPVSIAADPTTYDTVWFTAESGNYVGRLELQGG